MKFLLFIFLMSLTCFSYGKCPDFEKMSNPFNISLVNQVKTLVQHKSSVKSMNIKDIKISAMVTRDDDQAYVVIYLLHVKEVGFETYRQFTGTVVFEELRCGLISDSDVVEVNEVNFKYH